MEAGRSHMPQNHVSTPFDHAKNDGRPEMVATPWSYLEAFPLKVKSTPELS